MAAWRIYYSDGTTYSSVDGDPAEAPAFGTVCIVFPDADVGRVVMHGWDWYYYVPSAGQWWGSDIHGLLDRLLHGEEVEGLKQGRNLSNTAYKAIFKTASLDPDFPVKTSTRKDESP